MIAEKNYTVIKKEENKMEAKLIGKNSQGKQVEIEIPPHLIIHLRRVLYQYDRFNPSPNNYNQTLIQLLNKFGKLNTHSLSTKQKKKILKEHPTCLDCNTTKNLTLDHVQRKCDGGKNNKENLEVICNQCHILREMKRALKLKQEQIKILKNRIRVTIAFSNQKSNEAPK